MEVRVTWLPAAKPVHFQDIGMCFYESGEFRAPVKGEFYLSGAIVQAWRAPNDLRAEYRIVRPTHKAKQVMRWVEDGPVVLPPAGE